MAGAGGSTLPRLQLLRQTWLVVWDPCRKAGVTRSDALRLVDRWRRNKLLFSDSWPLGQATVVQHAFDDMLGFSVTITRTQPYGEADMPVLSDKACRDLLMRSDMLRKAFPMLELERANECAVFRAQAVMPRDGIRPSKRRLPLSGLPCDTFGGLHETVPFGVSIGQPDYLQFDKHRQALCIQLCGPHHGQNMRAHAETVLRWYTEE